MTDIVDLSEDGRWILVTGARDVACGARRCREETVAVYDLQTGTLVGEHLLPERRRFEAVHFSEGNRVSGISSIYDLKLKADLHTLFTWDPFTGTRQEAPYPHRNMFITCGIGNERFFGMAYGPPKSGLLRLQIATAERIDDLPQPPIAKHYSFDDSSAADPMAFTIMQRNCLQWRSGANYLLRTDGPQRTLTWVSTEGSQPPQPCRSFPRERIHGYAVSPDRTRIVVITGTGELPIGGAGYRVFLNDLDGQTCDLRQRVPLGFPEKPGRTGPLAHPRSWDDHIAFLAQFAVQLAISPDNSKLAISYGIFNSPDGVAFFGIYSMSDGRRMATLRGDAHKGGVWRAIIHGYDTVWAGSAPIEGQLKFSPDSRMLFATSAHIYQWDVSGLR